MSIDADNHAEAAAVIYAAIRQHVRHRGCLVFLYVDDAGGAYVISEERPAAGIWMSEHADWWRSCYTQTTTLADVEWEISVDAVAETAMVTA